MLTSEEYQCQAAKDMSEEELLVLVIELARFYGYRVAHFLPGKTSRQYINKKGEVKDVWVTAVSADGVGFPDCVLAKGERVIFVELKSQKGKLTDEQIEWGEVLPGFHVWRPSDWFDGTIDEVLQEDK